MNSHTQTISIPKGTGIGVTTIPTGMESPYLVASAHIATQCRKFRATEKVLWIAFNTHTDWKTSSDEQSGKVLTPEYLEKDWGGAVPVHLVKMYEEGCFNLKGTENLVFGI